MAIEIETKTGSLVAKEPKEMLEMSSANLLGTTARWTAGVRAKEGERADRLFNDPWAAALAGPEGRAWKVAQS
jgi:O-methyltransferase involved in polyketide biosynthesis